MAEKKAAKLAEEDRIFRQIEAQANVERLEKEEFEQMRELLWQEEMERTMQEQEDARAKRTLNMKVEMIQANEQQKHIKEAQRAQEAIEEEEARKRMLQKFEDDEEQARAAAQVRLAHKEDYIRQINAQKQHRRTLYDRDVEAQKIELKKMQDEEAFRQVRGAIGGGAGVCARGYGYGVAAAVLLCVEGSALSLFASCVGRYWVVMSRHVKTCQDGAIRHSLMPQY